MDRLNDINLAWIPLLILACAAIGAALAWLTERRHR